MKRKEVTRWLALGLAAVMSTTILAGCGNTDDSSKGGDDAKGDGGLVL